MYALAQVLFTLLVVLVALTLSGVLRLEANAPDKRLIEIYTQDGWHLLQDRQSGWCYLLYKEAGYYGPSVQLVNAGCGPDAP